jgi:hypothetical protein
LTDSECVVVVVVVGAGFSTTVVHEARSTAATASAGVRIISFFIVGVVPSRTNRRRFLGQMYFERRFSDQGLVLSPKDWRANPHPF